MGILPKLIWIIIYMACVAIDVVVLLLLCRMVSMWHSTGWLNKINDKAKGFLDPFNIAVGQLWYKATQKHLSQRGRLIAALLLLILGRLVLSEMARLL